MKVRNKSARATSNRSKPDLSKALATIAEQIEKLHSEAREAIAAEAGERYFLGLINKVRSKALKSLRTVSRHIEVQS
jgi:hypothetical protein